MNPQDLLVFKDSISTTCWSLDGARIPVFYATLWTCMNLFATRISLVSIFSLNYNHTYKGSGAGKNLRTSQVNLGGKWRQQLSRPVTVTVFLLSGLRSDCRGASRWGSVQQHESDQGVTEKWDWHAVVLYCVISNIPMIILCTSWIWV